MSTIPKLSSLIIDDEIHARKLLETLIDENCPAISVADHAETVDEAISKIEELKPDLIFLDIKLKNRSGFEVLETLTNRECQVIFTTAYSEFALKAFDYSAAHYLLKPINIEQLEQAVDRAIHKQLDFRAKEFLDVIKTFREISNEKIALPNRTGEEYVYIKDIICCTASGSYTEIHFNNGKCTLVSKPLGYFEKKLNPQLFSRTHKKYIVNLQEVNALEKGRTSVLTLSGGLRVDVSQTYKEALMRKLEDKITF